MGDPSGIGPEVIVKAAGAMAARERAARLIVIGDVKTMSEAAERVTGAPAIHGWQPGERLPAGGLAVLAATELEPESRIPAHPTVAGGEASYRYVVTGAQMALSGEVDALVTAPISKQWWDSAGHRYPGHSELLAELSHTRLWRMMFVGDRLKVALVTVHMGLAKVSRALTRTRVLDTIRLLARHMHDLGIANPRLGVLGFNPHAGENGLFGDEEIRVITPAIEKARAEGIDAFGPLAPDTAFIRFNGRYAFDAAVAMYHDQGLIAVKTLEFDRAVNVTLGIPFIRTSPDHGTAFGIAGQDKANPSSLLAAMEYAVRAAESRHGSGRSAA